MRTHLFSTLAALLTGLSAQDLPPRPAQTSPPQEAFDPTATALTAPQANAVRERIANQPQERVLFDRPRADGPLWALGTAWKASFDATGFTAIPYFGTDAPRNFPLRFELAQATVGGFALPLRAEPPVQTDGTVRTARGSLTEVVDTRLDCLEQSFVFDALPTRAAIAVDVRIRGEFAPSTIDNGVRFANEFGHVDYTKAIAVDAKGERLPLAITWTGDTAHMEIPANFVERAQLPIVLDPIINFWYLLGSSSTLLQHDSDVASFQALGIGGRTLILWQRQYSAADQDCWGIMFDGNLGLVQTDFIIDFTGDDWTKVAVAANNYAQNFLVVAEIRLPIFLGSSYHIGGRTIAANATLGSVFDIERDGVVGSGGYNYHPDVGSDPYYGVGRYTVVFNKRNGAASDIYFKQVTTAGGLVTINPIALDTSASEESKPSISKSCGQSNGLPANWLVTWQRTWSAVDQDVYGRYINWNGALPGTGFPIDTSGWNETAPSASSPIDTNGVRYWPIVYESATSPGQPRDVFCRLMRADGGQQASVVISNNVPNYDDRDPEVDSDGTRFVTMLTTGTVGYPQSIQAVTAAYIASNNSLRFEERTGLATSSLDDNVQGNVCADYSGGGAMSPRYFLSFTAQSTNTFSLRNFGGYATSTPFFTSQGLACGNLGISASGTPALGQTITVTVGNGAASAVVFGVPGYIPLNALGCNCAQGVDQYVYFNNPLVWTVPVNTAYVGITLAVQGFTVVGSQCLGFVDLSDTLNFRIL